MRRSCSRYVPDVSPSDECDKYFNIGKIDGVDVVKQFIYHWDQKLPCEFRDLPIIRGLHDHASSDSILLHERYANFHLYDVQYSPI
jgi:hypothetical protein